MKLYVDIGKWTTFVIIDKRKQISWETHPNNANVVDCQNNLFLFWYERKPVPLNRLHPTKKPGAILALLLSTGFSGSSLGPDTKAGVNQPL
jgi:hypothetical protein